MPSSPRSEIANACTAKPWLILRVFFIRARHLQLEGKDYFRLLGRVKHEEEDNRVEQERLKGSTLVYGDKIQVTSVMFGQLGHYEVID